METEKLFLPYTTWQFEFYISVIFSGAVLVKLHIKGHIQKKHMLIIWYVVNNSNLSWHHKVFQILLHMNSNSGFSPKVLQVKQVTKPQNTKRCKISWKIQLFTVLDSLWKSWEELSDSHVTLPYLLLHFYPSR